MLCVQTTAVDIFSLGCVYYYVISNGQHPFGDVVKRQLNILSYEYDLKMFTNADALDSGGVLADELIRDMISKDPSRRPTAKALLTHPFFWNAEKILSFLQVKTKNTIFLSIFSYFFRIFKNENKILV